MHAVEAIDAAARDLLGVQTLESVAGCLEAGWASATDAGKQGQWLNANCRSAKPTVSV